MSPRVKPNHASLRLANEIEATLEDYDRSRRVYRHEFWNTWLAGNEPPTYEEFVNGSRELVAALRNGSVQVGGGQG